MSPDSTNTGEYVIRIVNEHWIKFIYPSFIYAMVTGGSILLFLFAYSSLDTSMWLSHILFIVALILILLTHHWFFMRLLSEAADCIIITDKRLIQLNIRLLFHDALVEIAFDKMKTVEAWKDGLLQNILNYGTLHFEGTKALVKLVPHPSSVARDIEQAMGRR